MRQCRQFITCRSQRSIFSVGRAPTDTGTRLGPGDLQYRITQQFPQTLIGAGHGATSRNGSPTPHHHSSHCLVSISPNQDLFYAPQHRVWAGISPVRASQSIPLGEGSSLHPLGLRLDPAYHSNGTIWALSHSRLSEFHPAQAPHGTRSSLGGLLFRALVTVQFFLGTQGHSC